MMRPEYSSSDLDAAIARHRAASKAMEKTIKSLESSAHRPIRNPSDIVILESLRSLNSIGQEGDAAKTLLDEVSRAYIAAAGSSQERIRRSILLLDLAKEIE